MLPKADFYLYIFYEFFFISVPKNSTSGIDPKYKTWQISVKYKYNKIIYVKYFVKLGYKKSWKITEKIHKTVKMGFSSLNKTDISPICILCK